MPQPFDRVYNFSAGPCTLPVEVLESAKEDLLNYKGTGCSVMEMSHRSKPYEAIIAAAESDLRSLMAIPEGYKVLFLQGGASLQFSMIPMNFLPEGKVANFILTGAWGKKAIEAAGYVGKTHKMWDGKESNYDSIPNLADLKASDDAAFIHYTSNETIQGVGFPTDPEISGAPMICDMSSDILSRPLNVGRYDMIYAGAQKNMGPAGAAVIIIKEELMARAPERIAPMFDYRIHAENGSMYNTPPCFSIYMCGLVYAYMLRNGGLAGAEARNAAKAKVIYDAIDGSGGFFKGHAQMNCRSKMNITFTLPSDELTTAFLAGAKENKMIELKGHRSVGGCRASIYNAFPLEGAQALADFMGEFARKNG